MEKSLRKSSGESFEVQIFSSDLACAHNLELYEYVSLEALVLFKCERNVACQVSWDHIDLHSL
jgi:hypothetical protein